jgi:hypothetical protein
MTGSFNTTNSQWIALKRLNDLDPISNGSFGAMEGVPSFTCGARPDTALSHLIKVFTSIDYIPMISIPAAITS